MENKAKEILKKHSHKRVCVMYKTTHSHAYTNSNQWLGKHQQASIERHRQKISDDDNYIILLIE